jgi:hypothetical protein
MELANRDGSVLVLLPPDGKDIGERLAAAVTLFRLANPSDRVLTA